MLCVCSLRWRYYVCLTVLLMNNWWVKQTELCLGGLSFQVMLCYGLLFYIACRCGVHLLGLYEYAVPLWCAIYCWYVYGF